MMKLSWESIIDHFLDEKMKSLKAFLLFLVFFGLSWKTIDGYKILIVYAHDLKSHLGNMVPLIKR